MRGWARALALLSAVGAVACGGGPRTAAPPTVAATADPAKLVELDAAGFESLVIGSGRVALVEFHSPT